MFKLDTKAKETVLYSFNEANGDGTPGSLIMDSAGNIYGTTNAYGPTSFLATLHKLDPKGNETVLYSFTSANGGPNSGLVMDGSGNLYGTTSGGSANLGTVFKLDPAGHEMTLYSFIGGTGDGSLPNGGLIIDGDGNLFGTTAALFHNRLTEDCRPHSDPHCSGRSRLPTGQGDHTSMSPVPSPD